MMDLWKVMFLNVTLIFFFVLVVCSGFSPIIDRRYNFLMAKKSLPLYSVSAEEEGMSTSPIVDLSNTFFNNERAISFHHTCIKTRDILAAIKFYGLLGFQVDRKFLLPGSVRAAWMKQLGGGRLELMEIPHWNLNESPGTRRQAMDYLDPANYLRLGYHHMALDVTASMKGKNMTSLCDWIANLNQTSIEVYNKHIRLAMPCRETAIGQSIYDLAMIRDPDGCLVELVHYRAEFENEMLPDW